MSHQNIENTETGVLVSTGGTTVADAFKTHGSREEGSGSPNGGHHVPDRRNLHHNREGPSGAPYDPSYTDHEELYATNPKAGIHPHHLGPAGAPNDPSYISGEGNDFSKTAATDSENNIGVNRAHATAVGAESHSQHNPVHHNRAGPSGAPFDSSFNDHEERHAFNAKAGNHPHHIGPAGAPYDQSFVTGDGNDYSKTAATDTGNNAGHHLSLKTPEDTSSDKHSSGFDKVKKFFSSPHHDQK